MFARNTTTIREDHVPGSSNRSFGLLFTVVFLLIGLWPLAGDWVAFDKLRWWSIALAILLLVSSLLMPRVLAPANKVWTRFGLLLHRVVSPIILGAMFFIVLTPVAWIMRARGKDILNLEKRSEETSYWIERTDEGHGSMKNQF